MWCHHQEKKKKKVILNSCIVILNLLRKLYTCMRRPHKFMQMPQDEMINCRITCKNRLQTNILLVYSKSLLPREIIFPVYCHFILPIHHLVTNFSYSAGAKSIFKFPHSFCVTASLLSPVTCWLSVCWLSQLR